MTIHNHISENQPPHDTPVESVTPDQTSDEVGEISFKINRQTLVVAALALILAISVFETIELTRLHQALRIWQTLPSAAAYAPSAPAVAPSGSALPAQVGGC